MDEKFDQDFGPVLAGLKAERGSCPDVDRLSALEAAEVEGEEAES
jgi:hypothetical protein